MVTAGGLGFMHPFSGTWGSLPPVVLAGVLILAGFGPTAHPVLYNSVLVATLIIFSAACVLFGDAAEARFNKKDPGEVVADEVAGQSIALLALPLAVDASFWQISFACMLAFFSFRFFDILKPPPANGMQKLPAGWGVLIDDLFAGVYALIVVQITLRMMW